MKRFFSTGTLLSSALVFFLLLLRAQEQHWFLRKEIFLLLGSICALAALVCQLRQHRRVLFFMVPLVLLAGYAVFFCLTFRSANLADFLPAGYTVESLSFTLRDDPEAIHYLWQPGEGQPALQPEEPTRIEGGTCSEEALRQALSVPLRSYWWPGQTKDLPLERLSIRLTKDHGWYTLSLRQSDGRFTVTTAILENQFSPADESSDWLLFGDLSAVIPPEVLALVQ